MRFPDGPRKKVERVDKADAQRDLDELVSARALGSTAKTKNVRQATFAEIIDEWFAARCPNVKPTKASRHARVKSPNTVANARQLLGTSVRPVIGRQSVDRTTTERLEELLLGATVEGTGSRAESRATVRFTWDPHEFVEDNTVSRALHKLRVANVVDVKSERHDDTGRFTSVLHVIDLAHLPIHVQSTPEAVS